MTDFLFVDSYRVVDGMFYALRYNENGRYVASGIPYREMAQILADAYNNRKALLAAVEKAMEWLEKDNAEEAYLALEKTLKEAKELEEAAYDD